MLVGELAYAITAKDQGFQTTLRGADRAMDQAAGSIEQRANRMGSMLAKVFTGAVIFGFVRDTIQAGAQFQTAMNQFGAVSQATAGQMERAGKIAMQLGNDVMLPAASALDAASAMEVLARGGLSASDSMDAARGTLLMAAAAGTDAASAAELTADALNTFNLNGQQASMVANVLAGAANAATGEIGDFGAGLQQSGSVAASFGMSVGETTTALAAMAQAGIKGSDAGTSLKSMLLALASPTKQQAAALTELGVTAYDANGQFVGMEAISGQLADAQGRLTQEQFNAAASTAFGTDAMRAAVAMAGQGAAGFAALEEKVTASGNAQRIAAERAKGMTGALDSLSSTIETIQLEIFTAESSELESVVRDITAALPALADGFVEIAGAVGNLAVLGLRTFILAAEGLSPIIGLVGDLAGWITDLPAPILAAAAAMLILSRNSDTVNGWGARLRQVGSDAVYMGGAVKQAYQYGANAGGFVAGIRNVTGGMSGLKSAASGLIGAMGGGFGLALTGGIALFSAISDAQARAAERARQYAQASDQITNALQETNGVLDENIIKMGQDATKTADVVDIAEKAGIAHIDLAKAYAKGGEELAKMTEEAIQYAEASGDFDDLAAAGRLAALTGAREEATESSKDAKDAAEDEAEATGQVGQQAAAAAAGIDKLREANDKLAAANLDANAATRSLEAAFDDAAAAIAENGATLDLTTDAGRANSEALDEIASAAASMKAAYSEANVPVEQTRAKMQQARDQFIATATSMGMTAEQAAVLADQYGLIPEDVQTQVSAPGADDVLSALTEVNLQATKMDDGTVQITIDTPGDEESRQALIDLGYVIVDLPNDKSVIVEATTDAAKQGIENVTKAANDVPEGETVTISAPGAPAATGQINATTAAANNVPSGKTTTISADTAKAVGNLSGVKSAVDALKDRTINIRINTIGSTIANAVAGGGQAEGGVYSPNQFMAGGGLPTRIGGHLISGRNITPLLNPAGQFLSPGSMKRMPGNRVTGDRTDVDELYAPITGDPRFWSLMREGARRGGGVAMPTQQYAGQIAAAAAAGAASGGTALAVDHRRAYSINVAAPSVSEIGQIAVDAITRHERLYGRGSGN